MNVDPRELERRDVTALINALVAPRPIAWVSTLTTAGERNLAPFSFFNAFSTAPPTIAIGPGSRRGVRKDSLANISATGEFTVNMVSRRLAEIANLTSAEFPPEVDEWEISGLTPVPSEVVAPPRVGECAASLECRVFKIVDLGLPELPTNSLIVARVVQIHVEDDAIDGYTPDRAALDLVGRLGGDMWCGTDDHFTIRRPDSVDPGVVRVGHPSAPRAVPALDRERASR